MARLVCALLVLAVATASASESRVIGGSPTTVEKYPSILQIQRSTMGIWRQSCAGIILTSRYSVSAASCFVGPTWIVRLRRIVAGSSIRNTGGQVSGIARIVKHPSWFEGVNRDGDVVVIQLQVPLQYTTAVQQATILGQGLFVPDNMPAVQAGWGMTFAEVILNRFMRLTTDCPRYMLNADMHRQSYMNPLIAKAAAYDPEMDAPARLRRPKHVLSALDDHFTEFPSIFSKELRELDVVTINNQRCAQNYATEAPVPLTVSSNMICAGTQGDTGACFGDRGGPLYVNNIVVGLISWGLGCTNNTFPTVHTAIPSYTDWIIKTAV